jgi:hypothetical protein
MTIRRFTRASIAVLFGAALMAVFAGTAAAHVPSANLTCNADHQPQLVISLTAYTSNSSHLNQNTVSASIDGVSVLSTTNFGTSYSHTFSAGSAFVGHTAQVIVFAWDDPTGSHGWTKTINLDSSNCQKPPSSPAPTATPTSTPTATPTPTPTPTPFQSFQGETATPDPTATPFQSFQGETATPAASLTPPPTSTGSGGSGNGSTPLFALLICVAFGGLGLAAVQGQRRSARS